jgi:acyl carrier protein
VAEIVARHLNVGEDMVDLSSPSFLEQMGMDSLDVVELLLELEEG